MSDLLKLLDESKIPRVSRNRHSNIVDGSPWGWLVYGNRDRIATYGGYLEEAHCKEIVARLKLLNEVVRAADWFFRSTENLHEHGFSGLVVDVNADGTDRGADHAGAENALRTALTNLEAHLRGEAPDA